MATYRVLPLDDGVDQRSSWQVTKNGSRVSTHIKKSAAKREARRRAGPADEIIVHRTSGTIIGATSTSEGSSSSGGRGDDSLTGLDQPTVDDIEEDIFGDGI